MRRYAWLRQLSRFKWPIITIIMIGLIHTSAFPKEAKILITEDRVRGLIADYVEGQVPWAEGHIMVNLIGLFDKFSLPGEKIEYRVDLIGNRGLLGRRGFQIGFKLDGVDYRPLKVMADVKVEVEVVAVSHPIKRYQIISEDDLYIKKVTLYDLSGNLIFEAKAAIGRRAKRFIRPGATLTEEMIEEAPLVRKGDRVTIIVEAGNLMITALGEARMDGAMGKMIEVINTDSRRRIYGEVIDSGKVRVKVTY